jgi:hypothetical protein
VKASFLEASIVSELDVDNLTMSARSAFMKDESHPAVDGLTINCDVIVKSEANPFGKDESDQSIQITELFC